MFFVFVFDLGVCLLSWVVLFFVCFWVVVALFSSGAGGGGGCFCSEREREIERGGVAGGGLF